MFSVPFYSSQCRFLQALEEGQTIGVEMNNVRTVSFIGLTSSRTIGTRDLNGCTAIVVVSEFGALISHIAPLPYPTFNAYAGDAHMRGMITQVCHKIRNLDGDFCSAGRIKAGIVCATVGGQVALPDQIELADAFLKRECGAQRVKTFSYEVERGPHTGAKGTVFVDGRQGFGRVFVEDEDIWWFRDL